MGPWSKLPSHGRGLTHPDHKLLYGTHYKVETVDGEDFILLDLHTAFTIYRKQMISLHLSPSSDTFGGMLHGIQYSAYCKDIDVDNDLGTVVYSVPIPWHGITYHLSVAHRNM